MYTTTNFPTKKAMREAVKRGENVTVYQPGGVFPGPSPSSAVVRDVDIEGPHYPKPHTWYAWVRVQGNRIIKVIS